jgi:nucleotide-binding universal stress UspA family protein
VIGKILFPVDFSDSCEAMASYVKRAAAMFGSRVTLVHVYDLASHNGFELYVRPSQEIAEEHRTIARRRLDAFLSTEFPAADCPRILRSGEAAEEIAEVARTGGFDLIVIPTHAGRFRRMLLGSTAAKVLNDADCLVMTTEHAETIHPRPLEHRQWVCGISLNGDSERVLRLASSAAAQVGANLLLVHYGNTEDALLRIGGLQEAVGCKADVRIAPGPAKEALIETARESAADLLIIGRTPQSGSLGRIPDLIYTVVRDSPIPVLSV